MLTIHAQQLQRLDNLFEETLMGQIRQHAEAHFPDEFAQYLAHDSQHAQLRGILLTARQYALTTDANLTIFTDFWLIFGPGFPQQEDWATAILTRSDLSEDDKTEQLMAYLDTFIDADTD